MIRFEAKSEPLAPFGRFLIRIGKCFAITLGIVGFSLGMGTAGYHFLGELGWIDSLYNSAMILTGMGPVDKLESTAAKLFATFYALYSGIAFLSLVAVILAPVYHRFLHKFHLSQEDEEENTTAASPPTAVPAAPGR